MEELPPFFVCSWISTSSSSRNDCKPNQRETRGRKRLDAVLGKRNKNQWNQSGRLTGLCSRLEIRFFCWESDPGVECCGDCSPSGSPSLGLRCTGVPLGVDDMLMVSRSYSFRRVGGAERRGWRPGGQNVVILPTAIKSLRRLPSGSFYFLHRLHLSTKIAS